jgi:NTE family protein
MLKLEKKGIKMNETSFTISGGGLRSIAGLGAIKYLKDNGYSISKISGTSGGSIIGFIYALGYSVEETLEILKGFKKKDIFIPTTKSLCRLDNLKRRLKEIAENKEFQKKFISCATDLKTGKPVYFISEIVDKEIMIDSVIASSSLIPFFPPVKIEDRLFIDGGYSDNLPNIVHSNEIFNVSVNVNNIPKEISLSVPAITKRLLLMIMNSNIRESAKRADIFVNVDSLTEMSLFDFEKIDFAFEQGYKKAEESFANMEYIENIEYFK